MKTQLKSHTLAVECYPKNSVKTGKRGRKPMHGVPMRHMRARLDDATIDGARYIGDGNFSEGLRRAVATALLTMENK